MRSPLSVVVPSFRFLPAHPVAGRIRETSARETEQIEAALAARLGFLFVTVMTSFPGGTYELHAIPELRATRCNRRRRI